VSESTVTRHADPRAFARAAAGVLACDERSASVLQADAICARVGFRPFRDHRHYDFVDA
jgi:hypothetical protein